MKKSFEGIELTLYKRSNKARLSHHRCSHYVKMVIRLQCDSNGMVIAAMNGALTSEDRRMTRE
jgi:hypothetical protein